jgi:hypothetical protein
VIRRLRRTAVAIVAAVAFNYAFRTIVRHAAHVPDAFDPFTWPPIVVATIFGILAGAAVYWVIRRFAKQRADAIFTVVAYSAMVLSFATPIVLIATSPPQYPGTTWLTVSALELMHVSTALAAIFAMTGRFSQR